MGMPDASAVAGELHVVEPAGTDVPQGIAVPLLLPGTLLTIHTRHSRYRIVVIDGCRVLVSGGDLPEQTEADLIGAGDDGERPGWIVQGLRLELWTSDTRLLTSAVEAIDVVG